MLTLSLNPPFCALTSGSQFSNLNFGSFVTAAAAYRHPKPSTPTEIPANTLELVVGLRRTSLVNEDRASGLGISGPS